MYTSTLRLKYFPDRDNMQMIMGHTQKKKKECFFLQQHKYSLVVNVNKVCNEVMKIVGVMTNLLSISRLTPTIFIKCL